MKNVKLNRENFLNNNLDNLLGEFGDRKCLSMGEYANEREEDPRQILSYPSTPQGYKEKNLVMKF